jgi:hypothetical protein
MVLSDFSFPKPRVPSSPKSGAKGLEATPCSLTTVKNRIEYFINKVKMIFIPPLYSLKNTALRKRATDCHAGPTKGLTVARFTAIPTEDRRPFLISFFHLVRSAVLDTKQLAEEGWDFSVFPLHVSMGL